MWKSVKKGLPEKAGYYLVCHRSNLPFTAGFNMWGNQNFTVIGGGEDAVICDITNWMEIPPNSQEDLEESPSTSTNTAMFQLPSAEEIKKGLASNGYSELSNREFNLVLVALDIVFRQQQHS